MQRNANETRRTDKDGQPMMQSAAEAPGAFPAFPAELPPIQQKASAADVPPAALQLRVSRPFLVRLVYCNSARH